MDDQGLKDLEASVAAHANLESLEAENKRLREALSNANRFVTCRRCYNPESDWGWECLNDCDCECHVVQAEIDAALGKAANHKRKE